MTYREIPIRYRAIRIDSSRSSSVSFAHGQARHNHNHNAIAIADLTPARHAWTRQRGSRLAPSDLVTAGRRDAIEYRGSPPWRRRSPARGSIRSEPRRGESGEEHLDSTKRDRCHPPLQGRNRPLVAGQAVTATAAPDEHRIAITTTVFADAGELAQGVPPQLRNQRQPAESEIWDGANAQPPARTDGRGAATDTGRTRDHEEFRGGSPTARHRRVIEAGFDGVSDSQ